MPENVLISFVETSVFTRRITVLGLEGSLRRLQWELIENPAAGDVEPDTSGLRKIRLASPLRGKGKRGGARVHYLWLRHRNVIYLLYVYGKDEASGLTNDQKRQLRAVVAEIKRQP